MYTLIYNVALWNHDLRTQVSYFQNEDRMIAFLNKQKEKYVVSAVTAYDTNNKRMENVK